MESRKIHKTDPWPPYACIPNYRYTCTCVHPRPPHTHNRQNQQTLASWLERSGCSKLMPRKIPTGDGKEILLGISCNSREISSSLVNICILRVFQLVPINTALLATVSCVCVCHGQHLRSETERIQSIQKGFQRSSTPLLVPNLLSPTAHIFYHFWPFSSPEKFFGCCCFVLFFSFPMVSLLVSFLSLWQCTWAISEGIKEDN